MLSMRKGVGRAPSAARAMADHLAEATQSAEEAAAAAYYMRGPERVEAKGTAAVPREDMPLAVARGLGIALNRCARHEEVVNLLQGLRADGAAIEGKREKALAAGRDDVTFYDFTFSAPKSVSLAAALAPTPAERGVIVGAHEDAWREAMAHLEGIVAHARKGDGGSKGSVPGQVGWMSFTHHTSRPTITIPHREADGTPSTLIQTVKVAGDMQLHTHVLALNAVFAQDGTVGSMDTLALHERVHEVGAYYQAHLATRLRAAGIAVELDQRTQAAHLTAVPRAVCDAFSKRTKDGEAAAREYLAGRGLDYDTLASAELAAALKGGTRASRRHKETGQRGDDVSDRAAWQAQAEAVGYRHNTVINRARSAPLPMPERDRLLRAYEASLPILEGELSRRAVLNAGVARTAAARGLIASGVESAADIDRITAVMREHGVLQDGERTALIWGEVQGHENQHRGRIRITTARHVAQEREAMALATEAAEDRSASLSSAAIERAVRRVEQRDGLDFGTEHGQAQRAVMDQIGTGGRFAVAVGIAGAGKTTLLRPLVETWKAEGRQVYGTALAWRQADSLADAGIEPRNAMAIAKLLTGARDGWLTFDRNSVIVVDELSQVGTAQALALLKLRAESGATLVAIGDDRQGQAIEAGASVTLMRKALGAEAVPELDSTVRQKRERDRETAGLFRDTRAAEGIERLREDGATVLVPGGRQEAVEAVAELWEARHRGNANRPDWTLAITAPTNADARAIGAAIRERRRAAGQIGPDTLTIEAIDQTGQEYPLPLAIGDRVRLFSRTIGDFGGKSGYVGNNGSVVTIEAIGTEGLRLRNAQDNVALVRWRTLEDEATGRTKLTYGDALTVDSAQGMTATESIAAMPSGSSALTAFTGYVAMSRARETTWLVVSDGAERAEIGFRRPLGTLDLEITEADVWANVARNMARRPEKGLAVDLMDHARRVKVGTVRAMAEAFQPREQRAAEGRPEPSFAAAFTQRQAAASAARTAGTSAAEASRPALRLSAPKAAARQARRDMQAVREARRSMRTASQRPKPRPAPPQPVSATEAEAEFREALHRAGLRPKGPILMDGKRHYTEVEGSRSKRGFYVAHLDGVVPAGTIINHRTGDRIDWVASRLHRELSAAERAAERERQVVAKAAREAARQQEETITARKARGIWDRAKPTPDHPYLTRKGVQVHGMRQDRRGNLLVPMRDAAGQLWGVQTISAEGRKLYMRDGRKQGMHALLGELRPGVPLLIAEGFATAATLREVTGLPVAVAFDAGNLLAVATAHRERDPGRPIILMADNDHHLPRRDPPMANVGREKAESAAKAVGGTVLFPAFAPDDPGTDWNDYAARHGAEAVRALLAAEPAISQAMRDAGRRQASSAAPVAAGAEAARRAAQTQRPSYPTL